MTEQETIQIRSLNATRGDIIVPPKHARVVFDTVGAIVASDRVVALIECRSCDELVWYEENRKTWVCTGCGIDMTPQETVLLIHEHEDMLNELRSYAYEKAGKKCRLEKFLRWLLLKAR